MKKIKVQGICMALMLGFVLFAPPFTVSDAEGAVRKLNDVNIMETVEKELIMDPAVLLNEIDVTVENGIVTLSGSVDNILAKERAARVTETVKGVRSVINRIDVSPPLLRSDTSIARDVEDALLMDSATESFQIRVSVLDGVVTLKGTVDSWQEKRLAGIVAKGVRGVTDLENELQVAPKADRPDHEILAEIQKILRWDELVDHALIDVQVKDGEVELSGIVGSAAEKRKALIDAHVSGVESVEGSDLEVKYWARDENLRKDKYVVASDEEVREAVEDALLYDPRVNSLDVTARVDEGVVTLRGVADNIKEKRAARRDALNTVGVVSVKNRLRVRPEEALTDLEVERKANGAITRDPYLETYEITVDVTGGTAKLYGSVDSYFEKVRAEDVISGVEGVQMVNNKLTVDYDRGFLTYDPYVDDQPLTDYDWYRPEPLLPRKSDAEIEEEIESEFWWSPFVDEDDVEVTVNDGRAQLTGKVDSWSEYSAATRNAYEGGAVWVHNNLKIDIP